MATVLSTIFYGAFTTQNAIAQVWSDIDTEQLSLVTPSVTNSESVSDALLITQLLPQEQQLIAQVWSDIATEQLSLASPSATNAKPASDKLLITQLLPQQQQLIAQVWSDIATEQLSLASPSTTNSESVSDELLITQLLPEEKQLIAQVWSDIASEQLSLATGNSDRVNSNQDLTVQPEEQLLINQLNLQQQKLIAQTWSNVEVRKLSLASPVDKFDQIPAITNPPPLETPVINPRSREEIAARIILSKVQIITPAPGVIINGEADSSVTIQYPAATTVKLEVNGQEVDQKLITNEQLDFKTNLITKTWSGAKLTEGKNEVSVIASKSGFASETTREVIVKEDTDNVPSEPSQTPEAESSTPNITPESESESQQKPANPEPKTPATEAKPQSSISDKFSGNLVKILTPKPDAVITNVSSTVIIQYPEEASVILQVNGKSVNASQVGRTEIDPITKIVTQTWYGVVFNSGLNNLSVLATTDGTNYSETSIKVHVPGKPKSLKVKTVESHIPADGKSVARVKGQFLDDLGQPSVWNETVTLNSSEGKFVGSDLDPDRPGFQVKSQKGEFTASLQAGYDAETVTVQAKSSHLEAYTQIQFKNTLREQPLLTGFVDLRIGARGTDYYDNFRDFLPLDEDNSAEVDFTSAAFITGSFGKWSYT
ncbi:MAG: hypothetical protein RLZZ535_1510, partial [Cyanobacteriota bacterium]